MPPRKFRKEKVRIGNEVREVSIPADALWGKETQLAYENFGGANPPPWPFVRAIILIKKAAARVHGELDAIPQDIALAIMKAADHALARTLDRHFIAGILSSGAGTSLHMNVNEVLANRATQILLAHHLRTHKKCPRACPERIRKVDPHNHVNFGQSTNDVIPTAIRIASAQCASELLQSGVVLREALKEKAKAFWDIKTTGRTHTRDALPIRLGERFLGYADRIDAALALPAYARYALLALGIGGTAVGTGANAARGYRRKMIFALRELCGIHFEEHHNLFAAMSGTGIFLALAEGLRVLAIELSNVAKDFELSSSGPNCGIGELILPAVQPGSSIMPGKINPTVCEHVVMACYTVHGNVASIERAASDTQWELNTRMPLIGGKLIESLQILEAATRVFTEKCVQGLQPNETQCRWYYENTAAWPALLNEAIGYDRAAELVAEIAREQTRANETFLTVLLRIARAKDIKTRDGETLNEKTLERLAFPKFA